MDVDIERFEEIYNELVDETSNPSTIHVRDKNNLLKCLLEVMEYLQGSGDENPLPYWFG